MSKENDALMSLSKEGTNMETQENEVQRMSVWHLLDGVGQMVTTSGADDRLELTVGCAPGYSADAREYTILLSREEAGNFARALLAWSGGE